MPSACRLTDIHFNPSDCCGCPACCHVVSGPSVTGSGDTFCNNLNVFRGNGMDLGTHCCCCGPNIWGSLQCSPDTIVNGSGWVRLGDTTWCCGGMGMMVTGSGDTIVN